MRDSLPAEQKAFTGETQPEILRDLRAINYLRDYQSMLFSAQLIHASETLNEKIAHAISSTPLVESVQYYISDPINTANAVRNRSLSIKSLLDQTHNPHNPEKTHEKLTTTMYTLDSLQQSCIAAISTQPINGTFEDINKWLKLPHIQKWPTANSIFYTFILELSKDVGDEEQTLKFLDSPNNKIALFRSLVEGKKAENIAALFGEDAEADFKQQIVDVQGGQLTSITRFLNQVYGQNEAGRDFLSVARAYVLAESIRLEVLQSEYYQLLQQGVQREGTVSEILQSDPRFEVYAHTRQLVQSFTSTLNMLSKKQIGNHTTEYATAQQLESTVVNQFRSLISPDPTDNPSEQFLVSYRALEILLNQLPDQKRYIMEQFWSIYNYFGPFLFGDAYQLIRDAAIQKVISEHKSKRVWFIRRT